MIAPTIDKTNFIESMVDKLNEEPTFSPFMPKINPEHGEPAHNFKFAFIAQNIKNAKENVKKFQSPRAFIQLGDLYLLRNDYKKALKCFSSAIKGDPTLLSAYEKIIFTNIISKNYADAEKNYEQLIEITNRRVDVIHNYALFKAFIEPPEENVKISIKILNEVIKKSPNNFEAINSLGLLLLSFEGDIKGSREYFQRSIEINPSFFHALNNYGVSFLKEENFKNAEKYLKLSIKVSPEVYPNNYQNLSLVYILQKRYGDALDVLNGAKENQVQLEHVWIHKIGWLLIMTHRIDEAIDWHLKMLKIEPLNDMLYNNLGYCFKVKNDIESAEKYFSKAVTIFKSKNLKIIAPEQLICFYNLARLAIDKGAKNQVSRIADDLFNIRKDDPFAFYLRGVVENLNDNFQEAKKQFERSLELSDDIPEIYSDYAFILECIDDNPQAAIDFLLKGIQKGFSSMLIDNNLAFAYIRNNNLREAEAILNTYPGDEGAFAMIIATKGFLELRKGNFEEGNEYYRKASTAFKRKSLAILMQIWSYEKALFWIKKNNIEKAKIEILEAEKYPISYVTKDLLKLKERLLS